MPSPSSSSSGKITVVGMLRVHATKTWLEAAGQLMCWEKSAKIWENASTNKFGNSLSFILRKSHHKEIGFEGSQQEIQ